MHSFSEREVTPKLDWAASSLAIGLLHPVIARLFRPASDLGLLSYTLPPEKSPVLRRSKFLALALYDANAFDLPGKVVATKSGVTNSKNLFRFICSNPVWTGFVVLRCDIP